MSDEEGITTGRRVADRIKTMFLAISTEIARRVRETDGTAQQWIDEAFVEQVVVKHANDVLADFLAGKLDGAFDKTRSLQ